MSQTYPRRDSSMEDIIKGDSPTKNLDTLKISLDTFSDHNPAEESKFIEPCAGSLGDFLSQIRSKISNITFFESKTYGRVKILLFFTLLTAYLCYILSYWKYKGCTYLDWANGHGLAIILYVLIVGTAIIRYVKAYVSLHLHKIKFSSSEIYVQKAASIGYYVLLVGIFVLFLGVCVISSISETRKLLSLVGYCAIFLFGFLFTKHPRYINWKTVFSGFALQMGMSLIVIKWYTGRAVIQEIGRKAEIFLAYGYDGARFVYTDLLVENFIFAFRVLPVLFFMVVVVNILSYYGWLQAVCFRLGRCIQLFLGTSVVESVNAVATVFLGMTESPLLFKTHLHLLTPSEIHSVMAAGFATVAGTMLAAYTTFGADPANIITASAMAAPAALAFSKLFYPEKRFSKTASHNIATIDSEFSSALDAACKGAFSAIEIVQGIIANVVACVSLVAFINGVLTWGGNLAGISKLTFEMIVSKIFIPLAWIMGVTPSQVEDVARLIGIKTVVNEFLAYKELGVLKKAGKLSARSEAIATFALCGFANPASVAIMIAGFTSICPSQRDNIIKGALRAFIAGSCTSFMSACLAGALFPENGFPEDITSMAVEALNNTCLIN